jgi:hypothetical protein
LVSVQLPPSGAPGRGLAKLPATRYNRGMLETLLPCAPKLWATTPAPDHPPLLEQLATLRLENAALRTQNAVLQERIRELEARLGQNSANSSRPPSSDPTHVLPKQRAVLQSSSPPSLLPAG